MSEKVFSAMPGINIGRTRWDMNMDHPLSCMHGEIVPLDCCPILPGDTFTTNVSSLIRMSTPIVPIMDNIRGNIYQFFVPMRLVWEHTKEFFGENTSTSGPINPNSYHIPTAVYGSDINSTAKLGGLSHHLGKPLKDGNDFNLVVLPVSVLKERAYLLVYNTFFRPQQFVPPIPIDLSDNGTLVTSNWNVTFDVINRTTIFNASCLHCFKQFDYFTSATLLPQYGESVEVPLGEYAELGFLYDDESASDAAYSPEAYDKTYSSWGSTMDEGVIFGFADHSSNPKFNGSDGLGVIGEISNPVITDPSDNVFTMGEDSNFLTNIVANLTGAAAASINTLRAAFAAQKFYERSLYGARYHEYIKAHFGINPPLGLLQVPELIGEHHFNINIQQVLSTADATDTTTTRLGQPGANSTTGDRGFIGRKAFVEHGFLLTVFTTTHDRHYTKGVLREDMKREMLEIYHPEFANLGDQAIYRAEIAAFNHQDPDVLPLDIWGFQEHWAEYRYRSSRASGVLDPLANNSLSIWTLTENYDYDISLDGHFLYENRNALKNSLVTGNSGPDYICDFYINYDVIRPMPLVSIPGRIDHVGNW